MNSRTITLKLGLSAAFILLVSLSIISMGLSTYRVAISYFNTDIEKKIKSTADLAALLIPPETHELIQTVEDEKSEAYKKIKTLLQDIRNTNPEIRFIYTMKKVNDRIYFIVDAETDPEQMSHVMDAYDDAPKTIHDFFENPAHTFVEQEFASDKWGTFRSGYAPVFNKDHQLLYAVGVDIDAKYILAAESQIRSTFLLCFAATLIITLLAGFYLAARISKSLSHLSIEINKVQNFDLESQVRVKSIIKEIAQVDKAVVSMRSSLKSFKKYVPSDLVTELFSLHQEARLGTEKKEISILFTDIADFTTISEKLSPEELSTLMSEYLGTLTHVIRKHGGTVDKFIGDAVMAFWNAPKDCSDHSLKALEASYEASLRLEELSNSLVQRGFPAIKTRLGIHTGEAIVGNVGTEDRMSYTALGDSVNLASRLESVNKFYDTEILISEEVHKKSCDKFCNLLIDEVVVKGKSKPTRIYTFIGTLESLSPHDRRLAEQFNRGMLHFFEGKSAFPLAQMKMIHHSWKKYAFITKTIERFTDNSQKSESSSLNSGFQPRVLRAK